jgi:DNA-binding Lrp family transcriptional regulator
MVIGIMDTTDKRILTAVNRSVPLDKKPYKSIADSLGIPEQEVIDRLKKLRSRGIIRRIGAVINPGKIGWYSTLCATEIPQDKLSCFADTVNSYPEVTHNYVRSGTPNCWFTLITPSKGKCHKIIKEIEGKLGIEILDLPTNRVFKIKVAFDIEDEL